MSRLSLSLICIFIALVLGKGTDTHAQDQTYTKILDIGKGQARSLDWKPDGSQLAVGSNKGVWLYDAELTLIGHLDTPPDYTVDVLAWSPDGSRLAASTKWTADAKTLIWDTSSWTLIQSLAVTGTSTAEAYFSLKWSLDSQKIALNHLERVEIWEINSGTHHLSLTHPAVVESMDWSADGSKIATFAADDTLRVWEADSGIETASLTISPSNITYLLAWNDDATALAFSSNGGIWRWDTVSQAATLLISYPGSYFGNLLWQGDYVAGFAYNYLDHTNTLTVWDTLSGEISNSIEISLGDIMAWKPNSTKISLSVFSHIVIWDFPTGHIINSDESFAAYIETVAWSPDGTKLVSGGNQPVQVWDAYSGELLTTLSGYTRGVHDVVWNSDSKLIAGSGFENTIHVWDATTGETLHILNKEKGYTTILAWHPSNRHQLAIINYGRFLRIWDIATQQELIELSEQGGGRRLSIRWHGIPTAYDWQP